MQCLCDLATLTDVRANGELILDEVSTGLGCKFSDFPQSLESDEIQSCAKGLFYAHAAKTCLSG
jgi:hypothetical protein